jgi:hypothetical protein
MVLLLQIIEIIILRPKRGRLRPLELLQER